MAVYVDELKTYPEVMLRKLPARSKTFSGGGKQWCHLTADTTEELVAFATGQLGMRASWHQRPRTRWEHFDLTPAKRVLAVRKGAVETTAREDWRRRIEQYGLKGVE